MNKIDALIAQIAKLPAEDQARIRLLLSQTAPPHPMELRLKASTDTILEALARSTALTIRGIEGILAEASFATEVLPAHPGLTDRSIAPNAAYDFAVAESPDVTPVRIQVKMQRRKNHQPMMANQILKKARSWPATSFVVEVQRTRGGKGANGESTRPYKFGEFDVLAVSLGASTGSWSNFVYTVANWLIPDPEHPKRILKYQPVSALANDDWTTDLPEAIARFRKNLTRTNAG